MSNPDEDEGRRTTMGCLLGLILGVLFWATLYVLWFRW